MWEYVYTKDNSKSNKGLFREIPPFQALLELLDLRGDEGFFGINFAPNFRSFHNIIDLQPYDTPYALYKLR